MPATLIWIISLLIKTFIFILPVLPDRYSDIFDLDPVTGSLGVKATWWSAPYRKYSYYQLMVEVRDHGSPSLAATVPVYVST